MFHFLTELTTIAGWIIWIAGGAVPLLIAAAVIWFFPSFRQIAALAAAFWFAAFTAYTVGDTNGASRVQSKWDAAEQYAVREGRDAHAQAERTIEQVLAEPDATPACDKPVPGPPGAAATPARRVVPRPVPRWMQNDRHNRDNKRPG